MSQFRDHAYAGTPFDLTGKTALIAGAAGLLGQEFAKAMASAGAQIVLADVNEAGLSEAAKSLEKVRSGVQFLIAPVDITDEVSVSRCVSSAVDRFGSIDILINSAGLDAKFDPQSNTTPFKAFTEFSNEDWNASLAVNLTGLFLLTQKVCAVMEKKGRGSIINIGSQYGMVGPDQRIYKNDGKSEQTFKPPTYSTSKAGVLGFTTYLAAYYSGTQIRVNTLTPAGVFNEHNADFEKKYSERTILRRMSRKDEFGGAAIFLASEASSYMTGSNLVIDGGWTAL